MARRGKTAAILCSIAGIAVVIVLGWLLRYRILERWWIHQLGNQDPEIRRAAARSLGQHGSRDAIPALVECYLDGPAEDAILDALIGRGPEGVTPLLDALHGENRAQEIIWRLDRKADGSGHILLLDSLPLARAGVRKSIYSSFDGDQDSLNEDVLSRLKVAVERETDPEARFEGAMVLARIQPGLRAVRMGLLGGLEDPEIQDAAIKMLIAIAPYVSYADPALVPVLLPRLLDGSSAIRREAGEAIGEMDPLPKGAIERMIPILGMGDDGLMASGAPARMEGARPAFMRAMDELLRDEEKVDERTVRIIADLDPKDGLPILIKISSSEFPTARWGAIRAMARIAPEDPRILKTIRTIPNALAVAEADLILGRIRDRVSSGTATEDELQGLAPFLEEGKGEAFDEAVRILAHAGKEDWPQDEGKRRVVPILLDQLGDPFKGSAAAGALAALGARAVPDLIAALGKAPLRIRPRIARVLGRIGPPARDAVPALRACLGGEDEELDLQARKALERIEGKLPEWGPLR
jgi:HEAT repeat protein